jgi:signal transduction histidine kinase
LSIGAVGALSTPASLAQSDRPAEEKTWRIVVLNNADFLLPSSALMDQALRETLTREAPHSVELFGEALDSIRHPGTVDDLHYALLRKKYEKIKVDLVMLRGRGSIDFVRRYGEALWPKVPVVFYNERLEGLRDRGAPANSTGVLVDIDAASTIDLALRLHPRARNIYVVGGTAAYDQTWKRRVQPLLSRLNDFYSITWLDHLPVPRILETVAELPPDSLVLYTSILVDAEGQTRTNPQVAGQVAAASAAPVYGYLETYLGGGLVGGAIPDLAAHGRDAARLALRVLNGERASTIPVIAALPAKCVVDERAMRRFGIDPTLLPSDCDVRFRTPSVWREYRWHMLAALAAIALQSLLIAALIVQRRQRRVAELAAHQQSMELAHTLRLSTVGEMTAAISHEINQPLGAILSNAEAAEMLLDSGVSGAHSIDQLRHILADIRRDDLRASEVVRRLRAFLQKHDVEWQTFDLNEVALDTLRLVGIEAARREVTVDVQTAPQPLRVNGDRIQLQQLLINLVINAMDAMANTSVAARKVTLQLSRAKSGKVEIAVIDGGHGIEAGVRHRLFDSFFTTKPKGLGLGLSIARTIAEAHAGSIRAENNSSRGAIFRVTLPEAQEKSPPPQATAQALQAGAT